MLLLKPDYPPLLVSWAWKPHKHLHGTALQKRSLRPGCHAATCLLYAVHDSFALYFLVFQWFALQCASSLSSKPQTSNMVYAPDLSCEAARSSSWQSATSWAKHWLRTEDNVHSNDGRACSADGRWV